MTTQNNYVAMAKEICKVCGQTYENGTILLNRRLGNIKPKQTIVGQGMCPTDKQKYDEGYLALVVADPAKSNIDTARGMARPENMYRTGEIAHIRREVAKDLFNVEVPENTPMVFIDNEVLDKLKSIMGDG